MNKTIAFIRTSTDKQDLNNQRKTHFTLVFLFMQLFINRMYALEIDFTHDPRLKSWIESANDPTTDFPIQNLPFGVFIRKDSVEKTPHIGVAIGQRVLDLKGCVDAHLFDDLDSEEQNSLCSENLNRLCSLGRPCWLKIRHTISRLLQRDSSLLRDQKELHSTLIIEQAQVDLIMPVKIEGFTDFYASIDHAKNVGRLLRPSNPLVANYKHMPIGYNGRASSIVISGTHIMRPHGQLMLPNAIQPIFDVTHKLDYEVELGILIGPGTSLGYPLEITQAENHIFGLVIVNDWSARDIQSWEYQPLGPFNGKNFATTISPWVVTLDALAPYITKALIRAPEDPPLLDYLQSDQPFAFSIIVEAFITSQTMRNHKMQPLKLSRGDFSCMYWTFNQMLAHHASSGCLINTGDLLASGTISGNTPSCLGCLLEQVVIGGPIVLPDGSTRTFLQDGDKVIIRAYTENNYFVRIGFGQCTGVVVPPFLNKR